MNRWTTPQWIRMLAAGAVLLAVVLGIVLASVASGVRDGLDVIGGRAAPQVSAATDLSFALADADAQLANVLLVGDDPEFAAIRKQSLNLFDQRRAQADADLQQIATDSSAREAVRGVLDRFGRYQTLAGQVVLLDQGAAAGRPNPATLAVYRQATTGMQDTLRAVRDLTDANHKLLNTTYESAVDDTVTARAWVLVCGIALVLVLAGAQLYLRLRLRRRLNLPLVLAMLVGAGLTLGGTVMLANESDHLNVAKSSAFDSIIALSQARAVSYDANADESRYLVDPVGAVTYQKSFLDKSTQLAGLGADLTHYDAKLADGLKAYQARHSDVRFTGFFGAELKNITFPGEREAAEKTLAAYQVYQLDDRKIRAMATAGDLRGAILFCIRTTPGNSNYDFAQYDTALTALIAINQGAFEGAVADGKSETGGWTGVLPAVLVLLIAALVFLGVRPRLAEYR